MSAVQVLFFGPAKDAAGTAAASVELAPKMTLGGLCEAIFAKYPRLARGRAALRFAVNGEFASLERPIQAGDEVAVIPPVSGGQDDPDLIALTAEAIDGAHVRRFVGGDASLGGIVCFEGATRFERHPQHGGLVRLEYEAYEDMALRQMRAMVAEARERWAVGKLAIVHRTGAVEPGEASVMIAVACPHRGDAFEACRWLIDTLKRDVPIWKREVWSDGESTWVDPSSGQERHG